MSEDWVWFSRTYVCLKIGYTTRFVIILIGQMMIFTTWWWNSHDFPFSCWSSEDQNDIEADLRCILTQIGCGDVVGKVYLSVVAGKPAWSIQLIGHLFHDETIRCAVNHGKPGSFPETRMVYWYPNGCLNHAWHLRFTNFPLWLLRVGRLLCPDWKGFACCDFQPFECLSWYELYFILYPLLN